MARAILLLAATFLVFAADGETPTPTAAPTASVRLTLEDSIGQIFPQAVVIYDGDKAEFKNPVGESKTADEAVAVPPGRYWVVSAADESQSELVTVASGETKEVKRKVERSLWISIFAPPDKPAKTAKEEKPPSAAKPPIRTLIVLRPKPDMEQWLKSTRRGGDYIFAARNTAATDEDMESARKLALATVTSLASEKPDPPATPALSKQETAIWRARRLIEFDSFQRILGIAGKREDVDALLKTVVKESPPWWRDYMVFISALIEARHDVLESGRVAQMARTEDPDWQPSAIKVLYRLGYETGQDVLRKGLSQKDPSLQSAAVFWLSPDSDRETLKGMRAYMHSFSGESPKAPQPNSFARLHLLTFGEPEDWRLVASLPMTRGDADALAYVTENPRVLLHDRFSIELQQLRDRTAEEFQSMREWFNDFAGRQNIKAHPSLHPSQAYNNKMNRQLVVQSCFYPEAKVIRFYRGFGGIDPLSKYLPLEDSIATLVPWFSYPEQVDLFVKEWLAGNTRYSAQLEYVALDKIEDAVKRLGDGHSPPGYEIYRAYHKIAHRQWWIHDPMPMGERRWPYLFAYHERNKSTGAAEFGGGISGVASLKTEWQGKTLGLKVKLDQRIYYEQSNAMFGIGNRESLEEYPHHRYAADRGRGLLNGVVVRRGAKKFEVTDKKRDENGWFVFEAAMDDASLSDLFVDVNLGFIDQSITLTDALFVGTNATEMRQKRRAVAIKDSPAPAAGGE